MTYKKNEGFFYSPSENGMNIARELNDEYLTEISRLCEKLKILLSFTESQLSKMVNKIIQNGAV